MNFPLVEIPRCFKPLHGEKRRRPSGKLHKERRILGFLECIVGKEDEAREDEEDGENGNVAAETLEAMAKRTTMNTASVLSESA